MNTRLKAEKNLKLKKYIIEYLRTIIIGIIIGLIVGCFQLCVSLISDFSLSLYTSSDPYIMVLLIVLLIIFSTLNFNILKYFPSIDGSGIPLLEQGIRKEEKIRWKLDIPLLILNSFVAIFCGFPLGSEGPSVVLGGKIAQGVDDISKKEDTSEDVAIASGAGFGCAFLSPLAGLVYGFEESLHGFKFSLLFKSIIVSFVSFFVAFLINKNHLLSLNNVSYLKDESISIILIIGFLCICFGLLFKKLIILLKDLFEKYQDINIVKWRGYILFIGVFILNLFLNSYMGSGLNIIKGLTSFNSILLVIGLIVFRICITSLCGAGKVTGGLVIPIMCIGGLIARLSILILNEVFYIPLESYEFIYLSGICIFFTCLTKAPLTAIVLFLSTLVYSSHSFNVFNASSLMSVIVIVICFLVVNILNEDDLYDDFISIKKKRNSNFNLINK